MVQMKLCKYRLVMFGCMVESYLNYNGEKQLTNLRHECKTVAEYSTTLIEQSCWCQVDYVDKW